MKCYRCGTRPPLLARTICGPCSMELRAKSNAAPESELCSGCGLKFINDWERMKHEILKAHHYRAWDTRDGKEGMVARKPVPPAQPPEALAIAEPEGTA